MIKKECNIKVCRITRAFPPPWSGLNPGTYGLSFAQYNLGIILTVVTKKRDNCRNIDDKIPFNIYRIIGKSIFWEINAFVKFTKLNRKFKFDIIHLHGNENPFLIFLISLFYKKTPIVLSVHCVRKSQINLLKRIDKYKFLKNMISKELILKKSKDRFLYRRYFNPILIKEKICINKASKLLCVSESISRQIMQFYDVSMDKIYKIYNGVDTVLFHPKENIKNNNYYTLIFVGVMNGRKDVAQLLTTFNNLKETFPNIKLEIIGDGNLRMHYMSIANKIDNNASISFIRNIGYKDLAEHYQKADVFVFPSYYEGLPKVILEAMACGLPIVASNVCGNNDLIKNGINGYLFEKDDLEFLTNSIIKLLSNQKLREKIKKTNYELVIRNFTWDIVAKRCLEAYQDFYR